MFEREYFEQRFKFLNFHHICAKHGLFNKKHSPFCDFKEKLSFLLWKHMKFWSSYFTYFLVFGLDEGPKNTALHHKMSYYEWYCIRTHFLWIFWSISTTFLWRIEEILNSWRQEWHKAVCGNKKWLIFLIIKISYFATKMTFFV